MLSRELEALVARLAELGRPVVPWLVPGVDVGQVEQVAGVQPPAEVIDWFQWCNGVELREGQVQDDINVIPGYSPLSLREASELMDEYSDDPVLGSHWIPLLGGPGGDVYAAVWAPGKAARVAGVLVGESTEIEFSSVEQMVAVFNECYQRGAFYVDNEGRLAMDPGLYEEAYGEIVS
ncbi:SMI1/KNR4 family protein [Streptomyces sp. WAC00263]|uniref:SMI1/KNR4 family protein n=1 Tax=Streptomyces sp. WAC00263 TaxID=1917422 RepID=UPI0009CFC9BC|nr:SMI1/KNR4 family protein [Streptomyces sp. WAC00263]